MNMENVNAKVYEFLLKNGFKSFPINVFDLNSETVGFKIISYKEGREFIESLKQLDYANKHNGFAVNFNDKNYIFYSNNLTYFQRRCVVAHEI